MFLISEIGLNNNGEFEIAMEMIVEAQEERGNAVIIINVKIGDFVI